MGVETYSYTGQNIADEVLQKFGDVGQVEITVAMLLTWINNGQRKMADDVPFIEASASTSILAGQAAYDLSALFTGSRIQKINSVIYNGQSLNILPWSQFQPLAAVGALNSGVTEFAGSSAGMWGSVLSIFPVPDKSVANALTVFYYQYPADLAALANQLSVPDRFRNGLVEYVFAQALLLDENFAAAAQILANHQTSVANQAGRVSEMPSEFYAQVTMDPYDNDAVY